MLFKGKINKDNEELQLDKLLGFFSSEKYMEAIDLLIDSMKHKNSISSKAEEALQMILGEVLRKGAKQATTNEEYRKMKYYGECAIKISTTIKLPPPIEALGWYIKGAGAGLLGNYDEAIECFDKVVEIGPNGATVCEALKDKGTLLYDLGDYSGALECANKALAAIQSESDKEAVRNFEVGVEKLIKKCRSKI
ncbi:MAG: hypothetical protein A7315_08180 [Candidatus Altiarchaeales archaeon WOR_SM1_79]|nr:MAG: hypothetical protein A7315_08180 [Candidatus Altiarchaeales archaeon WOR_SM1_79]